MNFWETVFLFFALQAFIFGIVFFCKKKGDKLSNIIIGFYIILFGYNIMYNTLYWSKELYQPQFIRLLLTNLIPWTLFGPLLYFYVKRVLLNYKFRIKDSIHLTPLILVLVNLIKLYLLDPEKKLMAVKNGVLTDHILYPNPYTGKIIGLLMIFYFFLIVTVLKKKTVSLNKSQWLSWLSYSYLGYVLSFIVFLFFYHFGIKGEESDYIVGFSMAIFVSSLTYFAFLQPEVFNGLSVSDITPFKKYKNTGLTPSLSFELKNKLLYHMKIEKPYLNSGLKMDQLAKELNLSRHHLSQIINENFDMSFFDFINSYRIKEAKKKILSNLTGILISDIIYSCGFNNKVSFYKEFKKHTGLTPSQFKQEHQRINEKTV